MSIRRTCLGNIHDPLFGTVTYILDTEDHVQAEQALGTIEHFIRAERAMRERVFRKKPGTQYAKVEECDEALEAVAALREMLQVSEGGGQPGLFD